jgi:hypothetical protein
LKSDEVKRQLRDTLSRELGEEAAGAATPALKTAFHVLTALLTGEQEIDDDTLQKPAAQCKRPVRHKPR